MDVASAQRQRWIQQTTSVVVKDDLVPRFSLRSTLDLHRRAMLLGELGDEAASNVGFMRDKVVAITLDQEVLDKRNIFKNITTMISHTSQDEQIFAKP